MSTENRCAIGEGTNWFGKGRGLAVKKIGKLRTLVADPSMNFIDGKLRRANQANRGAHHTPVVLSARQKHPTGSAGPGHLDNALVQPAKNLVSPCRGHSLVVRIQRVVGRDEPMLGGQDHHERRSAALNVSTVGLVHHALVELQGRGANRRFFPGAGEDQKRRS